MLPWIYGLFSKSTNIVSSKFSNIMNPDNFIKELVTWIMVIIITFVIIGSVFKAWIKKPVPAPIVPAAPVAHAAPTAPVPPVKKDNGADGAASVVTEQFIRSHPW